MRQILILVLALSFIDSLGQASTSLVGRWKIIVIHDDNIYYDLENDSIAILKKTKAAFVKAEDSVKAMQVLEITKYFFEDSWLILKDDGTYEEVNKGKKDEWGTYSVDSVRGRLLRVANRNSLVVNDTLTYSVKNSKLYLTDRYDGNTMHLVLERAQIKDSGKKEQDD